MVALTFRADLVTREIERIHGRGIKGDPSWISSISLITKSALKGLINQF
jgi:hypothetical protein